MTVSTARDARVKMANGKSSEFNASTGFTPIHVVEARAVTAKQISQQAAFLFPNLASKSAMPVIAIYLAIMPFF